MPLLVFGLNYRTAPVDIRERVAFPPEELGGALRQLSAVRGVREAAILSTCNRTELYCGLNGPAEGPVLEWLRGYHRLGSVRVEPFVYRHPDHAAVRHMIRVASGLDSMILGEPQILGQMKVAYQAAVGAGTLGPILGRLFQHTFSVAKQIRTDTAIGASPVSVAFAAVSLAKQIFGDLSGRTAMLIGAGEAVELAVRHLHEHHIGRLIVANRNMERAHALAARFRGYGIALQEIPDHLADADIVVASTASPVPVLGKGTVERALRARKHRPMFLVDIAVPRDIEPEVGELPDVYLYTIDDLRDVIQENQQSRREAAEQAEEIIDYQVARFMEWVRSLDAVSTIRACRGKMEGTRDEVLARARHQLARGKDPYEVVDQLARVLTNKLLHEPSTRLRQAGSQGCSGMIEAARELFGLTDSDDPDS